MPWTVGKIGDGIPQIIINGVLMCDQEAMVALWDVIDKYIDVSMSMHPLVMKNQDHPFFDDGVKIRKSIV